MRPDKILHIDRFLVYADLIFFDSAEIAAHRFFVLLAFQDSSKISCNFASVIS